MLMLLSLLPGRFCLLVLEFYGATAGLVDSKIFGMIENCNTQHSRALPEDGNEDLTDETGDAQADHGGVSRSGSDDHEMGDNVTQSDDDEGYGGSDIGSDGEDGLDGDAMADDGDDLVEDGDEADDRQVSNNNRPVDLWPLVWILPIS